MAYIRYGIKYGNVLRYSGSKANSITIQYPAGTTRQTINSTTNKTLFCNNKLMSGNVVIGDKTIYCNADIMNGDLRVDAQAVSGSNYDVITSSGSWVVPPGVTSITAFLVGGGGAGGLCGGFHASYSGGIASIGQAGGGGGGKTSQVTVNVTPGEVLTCNIGAGGSAGSFSGATSLDTPEPYYYRYYTTVSQGGGGGTTSLYRGGTLLGSAAGGSPGGTRNLTSNTTGGGSEGGDGGSGGAGGADCDSYSSTYPGGNGGTNGGNGGTAGTSAKTAGTGQGTTTAFNDVTYAGGGGAGTITTYLNTRGSFGRVNAGTGGAGGGANGGDNAGTNGYGGGGGGYCRWPAEYPNTYFNASNRGGSGIIIIKWS